MSFVTEHQALPLDALLRRSLSASTAAARAGIVKEGGSLEDFARMISPAAAESLETMCRRSQEVTRRRFGKVIRLFAPIYLSNHCVNNCRYCGFARRNEIVRVTLSPDEARAEADALAAEGFRNLLLVASEHPQHVTPGYLAECVRRLLPAAPSVCLEVGPMPVEGYRELVRAGADGLVVFQETYDRTVYGELHPSGPKRDFAWRLGTPERAYAAGFRRIGVGALLGLSDWRREALCTAAHVAWLLKHCWKAQISISLPRLCPAASGFAPPSPMSDRELVQMICAYRLMFPDVGLVLSTREPARLRDGLIPLGITHLSAGSRTEPGGYTGAGREKLTGPPAEGVLESATGQFDVADERSAAEMAETIRRLGYEPVWKDWDAALTESV